MKTEIKVALIGVVGLIILGILTSPLWMTCDSNDRKVKNNSGEETISSIENESNSSAKSDSVYHPTSKETIPEISDSVHHSTSPEIILNIIAESLDSVRLELRDASRLRELLPLEDGKSISETPIGTFFFVSSIDMDFSKDEFEDFLNRECIERILEYPFSTFSTFEIHYINDRQIYILGFVSVTDAAMISKLNGSDRKKIILSPKPLNGINNLVKLPLNNIIEVDSRRITDNNLDNIYILDVEVQ